MQHDGTIIVVRTIVHAVEIVFSEMLLSNSNLTPIPSFTKCPLNVFS